MKNTRLKALVMSAFVFGVSWLLSPIAQAQQCLTCQHYNHSHCVGCTLVSLGPPPVFVGNYDGATLSVVYGQPMCARPYSSTSSCIITDTWISCTEDDYTWSAATGQWVADPDNPINAEFEDCAMVNGCNGSGSNGSNQ